MVVLLISSQCSVSWMLGVISLFVSTLFLIECSMLLKYMTELSLTKNNVNKLLISYITLSCLKRFLPLRYCKLHMNCLLLCQNWSFFYDAQFLLHKLHLDLEGHQLLLNHLVSIKVTENKILLSMVSSPGKISWFDGWLLKILTLQCNIAGNAYDSGFRLKEYKEPWVCKFDFAGLLAALLLLSNFNFVC